MIRLPQTKNQTIKGLASWIEREAGPFRLARNQAVAADMISLLRFAVSAVAVHRVIMDIAVYLPFSQMTK